MKAIAVISSCALVLLLAPAPAKAELGGYTLRAEAAPVLLHIYEPVIPIPAEPQLELSLAYSRAMGSTGPTGRAVSSLLWPGDVVGYGLPELLQNPDGHYPVKVDAAHPSGPKDAAQEPVPGSGMRSHASEKAVEAKTAMASHTTPAVGGLPLPGALISMDGVASHSRTEVTGDKAVATAYATAKTISLLGGIVKLHGLRAESSANSNGDKGESTSKVAWGSLTVVGQTFAFDDKGAGPVPVPAIPADVTKRLADYGFSITLPKVDTKNDGATGKVTGQGLTITLDTAVLRNKFALGWLLDPLLALLPAEARDQLTPWLAMAPKFVFILGSAAAESTASPAFVPDPITPGDPGLGGGSGSTGGGSVDGGGGTIPPTEGEPVPVANRGWPAFPGVPWYLIALGVLFAAGAAYGLRGFAAGMFGAGGCELGMSNGVPNLRER